MNTPKTGTLDVPGARLYYELRGEGPLIVLVGTPMDANSFAPVADLLAADHTVLTTDPRGINRSTVDDPGHTPTIEERANDLAHLIRHADAGPATVLGSSGGAVTVLGLAQLHPALVTTAIAHEPPLYEVVEDKKELYETADAIVATFHSGDRVGAMRLFLKSAGIEMPEPVFQAVFGTEPDAQGLKDERYQYEHLMMPTVSWRPDVAALKDGPVRLVIGIGEDSAGQFCDRSSRALAEQLGVAPTMFPGGHIGFAEDAKGFEPRLREVLAEG